MINFIHNISFQKEHFPEIFNSYKFPENEKMYNSIQVKESTYLYFLLNDRIPLMTHINSCFGVDFTFDLPASTAIILFGYENRILGFDEGIVKVSVNHPFLDIDYSIVFSQIVINGLLEKSYSLYSFVDKPLKQMTELQIRRYCQEYCFNTHNLISYDEILDKIVNNRPQYEFRYNIVNKEKRMYIKDAGFGDKYSLLIIKIINASLLKKENEIIQDCVNGVINEFRIRGKEIIEKYLQMGDFNTNFVIVERYFHFERKCKQELSLYFKDRLLPQIRNYKKYSSEHTLLHNMISDDENILEVDRENRIFSFGKFNCRFYNTKKYGIGSTILFYHKYRIMGNLRWNPMVE